ncbi:hypothetical protein RUM44_000749 [Polyplax serrata]|uniref:Uncharacterized protein n=1 Tax=Polyplax serrata TaxID=468196 RepID=A0ABR1B650_POLSC
MQLLRPHDLLEGGQLLFSEILTPFQKTKLGWIMGGSLPSESYQPISCVAVKKPNFYLKKFWQLEETTNQSLSMTEEDKHCEEYFKANIRREKSCGSTTLRDAVNFQESVNCISYTATVDSDNAIQKFSRWTKLQRVVAHCLRYISNSKKKPASRASGPITVDEVQRARDVIIKLSQQRHHSTILDPLEKGVSNATSIKSKMSASTLCQIPARNGRRSEGGCTILKQSLAARKNRRSPPRRWWNRQGCDNSPKQQTNQTSFDRAMENQLQKIANKIKRERKDIASAEKEAACFKEIHKLLENIENDTERAEENTLNVVNAVIGEPECSVIPYSTPWIKVFNGELLLSLFNEESICLQNFIDDEHEGSGPHLIEKNIRNYIAHDIILHKRLNRDFYYMLLDQCTPALGQTIHLCGIMTCTQVDLNKCENQHQFPPEILLHTIERINNLSIAKEVTLYTLYLISVHHDEKFIFNCHLHLINRKRPIIVEDIFPIFANWGLDLTDLYNVDEEKLHGRFGKKERNIDKMPENERLLTFNIELIGKTLISYTICNFLDFTSGARTFIGILARLILSQELYSEGLIPTYSTLLTFTCQKIVERKILKLSEIIQILFEKERDILLQVEICNSIVHPFFPVLNSLLVLGTISSVLGREGWPKGPLITINHIKATLRKLRENEVLPVEFYSILTLLTNALRHITATPDDFAEINSLLTVLESKINQTEDSVDLIRLKRELAKVRSLVADIKT